MTRLEDQVERERRQQVNEPLVRSHRSMGWYYVCPQPHGTMYSDFPSPEAAYRDWAGHSKLQHPDLPVGWPEGVRGPESKDRHECVPTTADRSHRGVVRLLCQKRHVIETVRVTQWSGSRAEQRLIAALAKHASQKSGQHASKEGPEGQESLF